MGGQPFAGSALGSGDLLAGHFDSQFLAQSVYFNFKLGDIPVPVRYFDEASSINFRRSVKYGCTTLWILAQYWLQSMGVGRFRIFRR